MTNEEYVSKLNELLNTEFVLKLLIAENTAKINDLKYLLKYLHGKGDKS